MSANGLKGPGAEVVFETCAGLAPAAGFKNRLADPETPTFEAEQVDAADDDIAPQILRSYRLIVRAAHQRIDYGQVFPLNQRHLPRIAHTGTGMITGQPGLKSCFHGIEFDHRRAGLRPHTDPAHTSLLRYFGDQLLQWTHRLIPTSKTMLRPRLLRKKSGASGWANSTRAKVGPTSDNERQP